MARDRDQPAPLLQVLLYPILDYDLTTSSYQNVRKDTRFPGRHAVVLEPLPDSQQDAKQPMHAPLAKDLHGLAPALVITAEYDVLCDEGEAYAERLQAAGCPRRLTRYNGMIHGFIIA